MISQTEAKDIAKKLGAKVKSGRAHDLAEVNYKGKRVAQFGIRRGSREQSHSYVPRQLYISGPQARDLAACPMSADDYFNVLIEKGLIQDS